MGIAENIAKIKSTAGPVLLLAVTKSVPVPQILEAIEAGITDIGENRVQEAKTKFADIKASHPGVRWHMIGHLQNNKVNAALEMFDVIESVDSVELAEAISKRAQKPIEIFIEVNTSGEESKHGIKPEGLFDLVKAAAGFNNLNLTGLMTMGPLTDDKEKIKAAFRSLRLMKEKLNAGGYPGIRHLSMGMSGDFPLAIEEGSDIIRVGGAIFSREG